MVREPLDDLSSLSEEFTEGEQFYRRAGVRLSEPQAESVKRISEPPSAFHAGYHAFDLTHTVMLVERELVSTEVGQVMLKGLSGLEDETGDPVPAREEIGHGAHSGEAFLIAEYGEDVGGWLNVGRSSHDLTNVAERFVLRERLLSVGERLADLIDMYATRAKDHIDDPIPTYTGLQQAQVGSIGYVLCSLAFPVKRDLSRLVACYDRLNQSPAGAAVGTTTDFNIDRERVASLLGFDGVIHNAEDVDKSVDHLLEVGVTAATSASSIGQAADQFLLWFSDEFGVLELPDRLCGTSSIMPQKKNPHSIQVVQRDTNSIIGEAIQQFVAVKNLSGEVSLSPVILQQLPNAIEIWTNVVEAADFDRNRAQELIREDWALMTDLAALLVRDCGISWRSAHQIIGVLVRHYEETGQTVDDVNVEDIERIAEAYLDDRVTVSSSIETVLDPTTGLERRDSIVGSPAPSEVREQIATLQQTATEYRSRFADRRSVLEQARESRYAAIEAIINT